MDTPSAAGQIIEFLVWQSNGSWWGLHKRPGGRLIKADSFSRLELTAMAARIGYDLRLAAEDDVMSGAPEGAGALLGTP